MSTVIYTNAQITVSQDFENIVHILSQNVLHDILIVLTRDEFTDEVKRWLCGLPTEQRQLIIDELTACPLRTLELES